MFGSNGDDYSHTQVPEGATVSGVRVAMTKLGTIIGLPSFIAGAQIGFTFGVARGLLAVAVGGLVLTLMAIATGTVAVRARLTTSLLVEATFGTAGSRLVNGVVTIILLGWFGVTAQLFGASVNGLIADYTNWVLPSWPFVIIGGVLVISTTLIGFRGLQRLADIAIPALLLVLVLATWRAMKLASFDMLLAVPANAPPIGAAISAIVGSMATGVVVFPDLARFIRSRRQAGLAAVLIFAVGMPVVLTLAAVPSTATHRKDLIEILTLLGLGAPAIAILILKAWASNAGNLYGASLGLRAVFPGIGRQALTCIGGGIGTVFALLGITDHLLPILMVLGITVPPLAGIYVADFLARARWVSAGMEAAPAAVRPLAFLSLAIGIGVSSATSHGWITLSMVPAIDSIVTGFLFHHFASDPLRRLALRTSENKS